MPRKISESSKNWRNQLQRKAVQSHAEGLILAKELKSGKISAETFARRFSKLREAELFESKTGLFTPAFFEAELFQEIASAKRFGLPLTLAIIDVDKLKTINDKFGHLRGDRAVKLVGKVIKRCIRETDVPCRWGGDEFTLLLPKTTAQGASLLVRRLKEKLQEDNKTNANNFTVTVSIGLTQLKDSDSADSFFDRADKAVYKAKEKGRDDIVSLD